MLELSNISLEYDRVILRDINLKVQKGAIIGIVGKSGAGKTSLLKIIAGTQEPAEGEIFLEGIKLNNSLQKLIPGNDDIGLVNQDFSLDDYHTCKENILLKMHHLPSGMRDSFAEELLNLMKLNEVKNQKAHLLSGGEQQRLAIARVLAKEPKLILLDEPFSHLDTILRKRLISYLIDLRKKRKSTLILVSHDGSEILGLSDLIYQMKNGRLILKGDPDKVYYSPKTLEDARLFGPMNSVRIGEKRIMFRPDEYSLEKSENDIELELKFTDFIFYGSVYENYFKSLTGEQVVLFSFNPLKDVRTIYIRRKSKKT